MPSKIVSIIQLSRTKVKANYCKTLVFRDDGLSIGGVWKGALCSRSVGFSFKYLDLEINREK